MPRIVIEALSKVEMRYDTLGDWFTDTDGDSHIQVVGVHPLTHNEAFLVALHELVEMKLCHDHGVSVEDVDRFDLAYTGEGEPGDAWDCPYRKEHRAAMLVEHFVASMLGLYDYGKIE